MILYDSLSETEIFVNKRSGACFQEWTLMDAGKRGPSDRILYSTPFMNSRNSVGDKEINVTTPINMFLTHLDAK